MCGVPLSSKPTDYEVYQDIGKCHVSQIIDVRVALYWYEHDCIDPFRSCHKLLYYKALWGEPKLDEMH